MPTYPAVPSYRMSHDVDGSVALSFDTAVNSGTPNVLSDAVRSSLNDEDDDVAVQLKLSNDTSSSTYGLVIFFPETRTINGYYICGVTSGNAYDYVLDGMHIYTSVDTTNGIDGTWVDRGAITYTQTSVKPGFRTSIQTVGPWTTARAVKIEGTGGSPFGRPSARVQVFHVYGTPTTSGTNVDIWQESTDARISSSFLDWGDITRPATVTKSFRVHNNSTIYTALNVSVSMEVLSDSTPSYSTMHEFSADGGVSWHSAVDAGTLGPSGTSGVIQVRLTVPADAQVGPWAGRIKAAALAMV